MRTQKLAILGVLTAFIGLGAAAGNEAGAQARQAGVSAGVRGNIQLASAGQAATAIGRQVRSGEQIFLGDRIRSGPDAGMQIVLLDETVFTIGSDSEITIDEFVYNPDASGSSGRLTATIGKGAFRFVTGKIAQARPEDMTVKTQAATIGVRGTIGYGAVGATINGVVQDMIALGGPGLANNANQRPGGLNIASGGGAGADLRRIDTAALVQIGQQVQFVPLTPDLTNIVAGALAGGTRGGQQQPQQGGSSGGNSGGASSQAGQDTAQGGISSQQIASLQTSLAAANDTSKTLNEVKALQETALAALGGDMTYQQFQAIPSGNFFLARSGYALSGPGVSGSYRYDTIVDFASRSLHTHFLQINTTGAITVTNGNISRDINYTGLTGTIREVINAACGAATCTGITEFKSVSGSVPFTALHQLTVTQGGVSATGSGSVNSSDCVSCTP